MEIRVSMGGRKPTPEMPNPDYVERTFHYDLGEDENGKVSLERAIQLFGPEVVTNAYVAGMKVAVRPPVKDMIARGKTDTEIAEVMSTWKPGIRAPRAPRAPIDPVATFMAALPNMAEEEIAAFLEKLAEHYPPAKKGKR